MVFLSQACVLQLAVGASAYWTGANLGGWLVMESWMDPDDGGIHGLDIVADEWTIVKHLGGPTDERAIGYMQNHWDHAVSEADLDELQALGVDTARIPIGYWLVDYDESDGFVDGGVVYLEKVLKLLQARNMSAILDLHALPGGQTSMQSFTGKATTKAHFFTNPKDFARGKECMLKLAQYAKNLESMPGMDQVVVGIELVNEPSASYMDQTHALYLEVVPKVRQILPANRYSILLNFMDTPMESGTWLANTISMGPPEVWTNVIYDKHMYHAYGDDDFPFAPWSDRTDSCKTCCRDPVLLAPLVQLPFVIGEWSLASGSHNDIDPTFLRSFWHAQQSMHRNITVGSFFWNHRLRTKTAREQCASHCYHGGCDWTAKWSCPWQPEGTKGFARDDGSKGYNCCCKYRKSEHQPCGGYPSFDDADFLQDHLNDSLANNLHQMIQAPFSLPAINTLDLSGRCPTEDLTMCPVFDVDKVKWNSHCKWKDETVLAVV